MMAIPLVPPQHGAISAKISPAATRKSLNCGMIDL